MAGKSISNTNSSRHFNMECLYSADQYEELLKNCPKISKCLASSNGKPKLFENILRITAIIIEIMTICNIPEFKANKAIRIIIKIFLHYDVKEDENDSKNPKRHIRKLEIISSLDNDCHMTKIECNLAYCIIKFAFYAFYYRQPLTHYDEHSFSEIHWREASRRTVEAFAKYKNLSLTEISNVSQEVNWIYAKYIERKKNECKDYEIRKEKISKSAEMKHNKKLKLKMDSKSGKNLLQELRKCQEKIKLLTKEKLNWEREMEESRNRLREMETEAENWLLSIATEKMQQENYDPQEELSELHIDGIRNCAGFDSWSNTNIHSKHMDSSDISVFKKSDQKEFSINFNVTESGRRLELEVNGLDLKNKLSAVNKLNIKNNEDVLMEFNCNPSMDSM